MSAGPRAGATRSGASEELDASDLTEVIDEFNDRLVADGHWVFAGGLGAPSTAADLDVELELAAQGSKSYKRRVELRPFLGG